MEIASDAAASSFGVRVAGEGAALLSADAASGVARIAVEDPATERIPLAPIPGAPTVPKGAAPITGDYFVDTGIVSALGIAGGFVAFAAWLRLRKEEEDEPWGQAEER